MKEQEMIEVDALLALNVADYAVPCTHYLKKNNKVTLAAQMMEEFDIRHLPIIEDNKPIGIVSQRDILMFSGFEETRDFEVKDIMDNELFIVEPEAPLDEVFEEMSRNKYGSVLVELDPKDSIFGLGIITTVDVLNAFVSILRGDVPMTTSSLEDIGLRVDMDKAMEDFDIQEEDYESNL